MDEPASKTVEFQGKRLKLLTIARVQRTLLYLVGAHFLLLVLLLASPRSSSDIPALLFLVGSIAGLVQAIRLTRALGAGIVWTAILIVFLLLPFVGLLILASLDRHATRLLRQARVPVRLFGVPKAEMHRLIEGSCTHCGYDIRGLPGPTCPECGSDLTPNSDERNSPKKKDLRKILDEIAN